MSVGWKYEVSTLMRLRREGRSWEEIGQEYGVASETVRGAYRRHKDLAEVGSLNADSVEELPDKIDFWELAKTIINANEITKRLAPTKHHVDYTCLTDGDPEWIGLVPFGDLHIDNINCTIRSLVTSFEMIANHPLIWTVGVGDYGDNAVSKSVLQDLVAEMAVNPRLTAVLLIMMFEKLSPRLIALASGCHDKWGAVGFNNFVETLCDRAKCQYIDNSGKLTIHVGSQTYEGLIGHKTQRGSNLNLTHGPRTALEDQHLDGDFSIFAHKHAATFQVINRQPNYRDMVFMLIGGWKPFDSFSRKLGFPGGDASPTCHPCLLLNTQVHEIIPVRSVPLLVHMLGKLNKNGHKIEVSDKKKK